MREYGFSLTVFFRISTILSLYGKVRVSENPYSRIFYADIFTSKLFADELLSYLGY